MSVVPIALICSEWPNPVGMAEIVTRDFNPGQKKSHPFRQLFLLKKQLIFMTIPDPVQAWHRQLLQNHQCWLLLHN